jgi:uncharacterized protein YwqG
MRNKYDLEKIITSHAKGPFKDILASKVKPSIRLKTTDLHTEIRVGDSKLGGCPDFPLGLDWPKVDNKRHYGFIGQINLDQVKKYDLNNELPDKGLLYFFHDMTSWENGKVLHLTDVNQLVRLKPPEDISRVKKTLFQKFFNLEGESKLLKECGIEIYNDFYFFPKRSVELAQLLKQNNIPQSEYYEIINEEIYNDQLLYDEEEGSGCTNHHLLGYHQNIQFYYYQFSLLNLSHRIKKLSLKKIEEALEWKLLFQFDSDGYLNMYWGDSGRVYFFIHKEDLESENFDNLKIIGDSNIDLGR